MAERTMMPTLRFVLALHNHQPIGNFDGVFEQAYQDSYRPFLDVFERYPDLRLSLHTSGCLLEWLDAHHPEYVDRLSALVASGRIEILGGAYYEAILPMIPARDRVGQIRSYTAALENRLGAKVRGMWLAERVWEQSLVRDLAEAEIQYLVLDDFHFRNAGLAPESLHGYYITEDEGKLLFVFPGSERLRYLIPFGTPHETIDYLRSMAQRHPGSVVVFGDDGEKFGTWPETKAHVYDRGWLAQFFDALLAQRDWLHVTTLGEAVDNVPPVGKVFLPDASYREMTEWVLPADLQWRYEQVRHELQHDPRWEVLGQLVRGGYWRNFRVKYPEADEMYARMLMVSQRLQAVRQRADVDGGLLAAAQSELYRGQCNCAYWHGAFGGIYLPHLRNAVYSHLLAADELLDRAEGRVGPWVEAAVGDYNLDARQEVLLANDRLGALFAPVRGGQMYELDVRATQQNLLATLARRPEAYHAKVLAGAGGSGEHVASIHDRVVFKQQGLDERLQYDRFPRKSLLDHFYGREVSLASVAGGEAEELGDFLDGVYQATVRRSPQRVQLQLTRDGTAAGKTIRITKLITLESGSGELHVAYVLENLPAEPLHFAVEWNFAGLPADADDRFFHHADGTRLGHLGSSLDLPEVRDLALCDQWRGIDVGLSFSRPTAVWTFPIQTVSQSEGGIELVHQSVVVQPHWTVRGDPQGTWRVAMQLRLDTSAAESRRALTAEAVATL
jgi:alpha-amylase